jgi:ribosomal protein S12 methylthiotransferase accessory factor YcaO
MCNTKIPGEVSSESKVNNENDEQYKLYQEILDFLELERDMALNDYVPDNFDALNKAFHEKMEKLNDHYKEMLIDDIRYIDFIR